MSALVAGMHFYLDDGDYFRLGKIQEVIEADSIYLLLKFEDFKNVQRPLELIEIQEMTELNGEGRRRFNLFRTEGELKAWMTWLNTPSDDDEKEKKVVTLVKK
jgi:hypothetical protein